MTFDTDEHPVEGVICLMDFKAPTPFAQLRGFYSDSWETKAQEANCSQPSSLKPVGCLSEAGGVFEVSWVVLLPRQELVSS